MTDKNFVLTKEDRMAADAFVNSYRQKFGFCSWQAKDAWWEAVAAERAKTGRINPQEVPAGYRLVSEATLAAIQAALLQFKLSHNKGMSEVDNAIALLYTKEPMAANAPYVFDGDADSARAAESLNGMSKEQAPLVSPVMGIHTPAEERVIITLDGQVVGSYNHDTKGWEGIMMAEELARNIADHSGIKIVEDENDPEA